MKAAQRFSADFAAAELERLRGLRVALIGETIIDEYVYTDAIGKSGKEPMLVCRHVSQEAQGGGVLAIANHLSEFCESVELVSALGTHDTREEFVRSTLAPRVQPQFIYKQDSPTIVKRRYLDAYSLAKLMGVYHYNPAALCPKDEAALGALLGSALERADLVIVADYGHGLLTAKLVEQLVTSSTFLAVNTQMNAANQGYHTLSKYRRLDYACLHEGELRLDARDLHGDLMTMSKAALERFDARALTVTRGKQGSLLLHREAGVFETPALATRVLERVGAGDAVLALTSLAIAGGIQPELVGILGNLAGAQQVSVMGNSQHIKKQRLLEQIREHLPERPRARRLAVARG
jgi:bifunctional ADP-heptose synthase (sugar kinase/adenylyltransferase)